jgi:membrane-bound lytic murein transglycosylase MltF
MRALVLAGLLLLIAPAFAEQQGSPPAPPPGAGQQPRELVMANKAWKGDFDAMLQRRLIRFAVPYSRTLYYNDKGREGGLSAELARDFESFVNRKYQKRLGRRPVRVVLIPTDRDDLIPDVADGFADIAAGNLTVTEGRLKLVDFVVPTDRKPSTEVALTHVDGSALASVDELAGKTVHVRKSSSHYGSLEALNDRFKREGRAQVKVELVPEELEDEDMMEMLNAGLLQVIVVDDWKAKLWARILPNIRVHEQAAVGTGGVVGWAIRGESPELRAVLEAFFKDFTRKQGVAEHRLKQGMKRVRQIRNNAKDTDPKQFQDTIALFRKYGERHNFDPVMLAAQGYQESRNIGITEPNVRRAAKHLDQLMARHFKDADFTESNRTLFAFASYSAGPANIAKMRAEAEKRGLDPNQWFNHVEIVTAEKIGIGTTTYVRNIYKYYVSYRFMLENMETTKNAREAVANPKK